MSEQRIKTWHWVSKNKRLRDGNTVAPGYVYSVKGPLVICDWGLHASECPLDALKYAPSDGTLICRCKSWGDVSRQSDKLVSRHREVLWMADAERTLHEFALWCAEQVRHLMKDERSLRALDVKRAWLDGKATDQELDAALGAALGAARDAAWAAARAAARDAAWDAAWAAAWAADRGAAREGQRNKLTEMLEKLDARREP